MGGMGSVSPYAASLLQIPKKLKNSKFKLFLVIVKVYLQK